MANILILIGAHICTAPRPQKEADTLAEAGHNVTIGGFWFDPELVKRDRTLIDNKKWRFEPIIDFQPTRKINNFVIRVRSRIAQEKFKRLGIFSPDLLGYGATAMLEFARNTKADLTIVHSESGLWVGSQLLNEGFKVGVDFEDWFSEDLLLEARAIRPISQLKILEGRLARDCKYCLTTSHALAEALSNAYSSPKPTVIYNAFSWSERSKIDTLNLDRKDLNIPSLHWFSQTIGPGRGLETLLQSLISIKIPLEIHLRGNYPESSRQWLEPLIPNEWLDRIFIHPTVPNGELLSRIAEHDIGLALECNDIPSRNLTVTNKLFQYLQAGVAVIATDTSGQKEILSQHPEIGQLIPNSDPIALGEAINDLLANPLALTAMKKSALIAAQNKLSWESQQQTILDLIEKIFSNQTSA
jgi:glycosyltransferase involved in cell wall biosynthesis